MADIEPYKDNFLPQRFLRWLDLLRGAIRNLSDTTPVMTNGNGSPEGVVDGKIGDQYTRLDGANSTEALYVKKTSLGTLTGWQNVG